MARTKQQQLDDLDALIVQIEQAGPNAQITILGRTFTKRDLPELYAERKRLEPLAARERSSGLGVQRVYPL